MFVRTFGLAILTVFAFTGADLFGQSMDGTWQVSGGTLNGKQVPSGMTSNMELSITGTNFTAKSGLLTSTGSLTFDGADKVTFTISGGDDQGRAVKAIYRNQNNILSVTFSQTADFPSTMDSTPGNRYLSMAYTPKQSTGSTGASTPGGSGGPGAFVEGGNNGTAKKKKKPEYGPQGPGGGGG